MLNYLKAFYLKQRYNFVFEKILKQVEPPFLVLAKHKSAIDSLLLSCVSPYSMAFCDETVSFENLERLFKKNQVVTILSLQCSKFGEDVIFLENAADLLARARYAVVFYNIIGDYFSKPMWARASNRGECRGFIKKIMQASEFEKLDKRQILELLNENLPASDYDTKELENVKYKGKFKAEFVENVAKICPRCKSRDSLKSAKNEVFCTFCGARASFDENMRLEGDFDLQALADLN